MNLIATAEPTTQVVIPAELEKAANETGLVSDGITSLKNAFAPHFIKFHELKKEAATIGKDCPKAARAVRLELRAVRVAADKTRALLKADSLRRGKAIDGVNAVLEYELTPIEEAMHAIENAELIAEQKRIAELQKVRAEQLRPFMDPTHMDLGGMPETQWGLLLTGAKAAHEAKIAAEAKAEAERVERELLAEKQRAEKEAAEIAERERMRAENERLAKIAAEEKAKREAQEAAAAKEREAAQKLAAAEKAKADMAAKIDRERVEALAAIERKKREEAEAELARITKEKAEQAAAAAAAAKKAKAAPDKEKLKKFAGEIRALAVPVLFSTDIGPALTLKIQEQAQKFAAWVEVEAGKL